MPQLNAKINYVKRVLFTTEIIKKIVDAAVIKCGGTVEWLSSPGEPQEELYGRLYDKELEYGVKSAKELIDEAMEELWELREKMMEKKPLEPQQQIQLINIDSILEETALWGQKSCQMLIDRLLLQMDEQGFKKEQSPEPSILQKVQNGYTSKAECIACRNIIEAKIKVLEQQQDVFSEWQNIYSEKENELILNNNKLEAQLTQLSNKLATQNSIDELCKQIDLLQIRYGQLRGCGNCLNYQQRNKHCTLETWYGSDQCKWQPREAT